jgi:hypothetical protein
MDLATLEMTRPQAREAFLEWHLPALGRYLAHG